MSDQPASASLRPADSTEPVTLPLPGPEDTPADLMQTMQERLQSDAEPAAEPAAPPLLGMEQSRESYPFVFHGETREYFRIWIVNTLLTLLTLGVYSAWAKVRKRRYLRGNTELMGHRFDYRADPRRILVGNILVAHMFLAYMLFGQVYPYVRLGALIAGVVLLPWVVVRSLSFNAHNTVYRGMRFYFNQTYGWTALTYVGQWFFIIITLGLFYPAWVRNRKRFTISNHRFGDAFFRFESKSGPFYAAYFFGGLLVTGAAIVGGAITSFFVVSSGGKIPGTLQLLPFFLLYGAALYISKHYIYARLFNHIWNHTTLDASRFTAKLPVGGWLKLQLVNLAAIVASCGLMYPWASIRSICYALASFQFVPAQPIESIRELGRNRGSAVGETAAEFVGLDFGL